MTWKEFITMLRVLIAARRVQTFLWGLTDHYYGLEEYRRMFRKRWAKIDEIDLRNPHWPIEMKKRLLQNASLCVALVAKLNKIDPAAVTNLPQYTKPAC